MPCAVCDTRAAPTDGRRAASPRPTVIICASCRRALHPARARTVAGVDHLVALVDYRGAGCRLVWALKLRRRRRLVGVVAEALAAGLRRSPVPLDGALVVFLPTTTAHRRARGFDQAALVARALARRLGLPVRGLRRRGPPQTGRGGVERRAAGPRFEVRRRVDGPVVLVDDVVTTGATLAAAADAVRAAGATTVVAAVIAVVA